MSLIFWIISVLFLKSENRHSDIFMNESFMYSPSVNGFPRFIISRAATKLAAVVEFGDAIHFFKLFLRSSNFSTSTAIALFLSVPTGCSAANLACYSWKCRSKLLFLLFDNFSLQIKHAGNPSALAMKANVSVHSSLNPLFSSAIFLFLPFGSIAHHTQPFVYNSHSPVTVLHCVSQGYDAILLFGAILKFGILNILHTFLQHKNVCVRFSP